MSFQVTEYSDQLLVKWENSLTKSNHYYFLIQNSNIFQVVLLNADWNEYILTRSKVGLVWYVLRIFMHLPMLGPHLIFLTCVVWPRQRSRPPHDCLLSHVLVLSTWPIPQEAEHCDQDDHCLQAESTSKKEIHILFWGILYWNFVNSLKEGLN